MFDQAFSKASKSHESAEASSSAATGTTVTIDEPGFTESPNPFVETEAIPIPVPTGPEPITSLETQVDLGTKCLGPKTNTCVIVLLPSGDSTDSSTSLASLAMLSQKHNRLGDHLFPFYAVPAINPGAAAVIKALNLEKSNKPQLVALNGKRRWWRHYDNSNGFEASEIESWIDGIRFGDSKKNKLPDDILLDSNTVTSVGPEESTVPHGEL